MILKFFCKRTPCGNNLSLLKKKKCPMRQSCSLCERGRREPFSSPHSDNQVFKTLEWYSITSARSSGIAKEECENSPNYWHKKGCCHWCYKECWCMVIINKSKLSTWNVPPYSLIRNNGLIPEHTAPKHCCPALICNWPWQLSDHRK